MFFYNIETQGAASGKLDAAGNFTELVEFPPAPDKKAFAKWTHIVG
jgi:hypothetical protein